MDGVNGRNCLDLYLIQILSKKSEDLLFLNNYTICVVYYELYTPSFHRQKPKGMTTHTES